MSDFLFSRSPGSSAELAQILGNLLRLKPNQMFRFEGAWGSLTATPNRHAGFEPFEDAQGISVVIGGPLFSLSSVDGPKVTEANRGTATITDRFFRQQDGDWHDDLGSPFCYLHVDQQTGELTVVSDSMSFIPVYLAAGAELSSNVPWALSTHMDASALAFAQASGRPLSIDRAAACDLILNQRITYPYTLYSDVRELESATCHVFRSDGRHTRQTYWRPEERFDRYLNITEAANEVRNGVEEVIQSVVARCNEVGLLLSAGEDSRTLACMIPRDVPLRCITVAPRENRESRIAERVAAQLGASWQFVTLRPEQYFEDVGPRALFTGSSGLGSLVHFLGVFNETDVSTLPAVLGGFKADTFLKGYYVNKRKLAPGINYECLKPQAESEPEAKWQLFSLEIHREIEERKRRHREKIKEFRPETADEWIKFWPMSQDHDMVHYWCNRRLFASQEAFMCPKVLDVASCLPVKWALNRRVFYKFSKSYLRRLWWIPHGDGHFPAYPWSVNLALGPLTRLQYRFAARSDKGSQSTWPSLSQQFATPQVQKSFQNLLPVAELLGADIQRAASTMTDPTVPLHQRYAYFQVLAVFDSIVKRSISVA